MIPQATTALNEVLRYTGRTLSTGAKLLAEEVMQRRKESIELLGGWIKAVKIEGEQIIPQPPSLYGPSYRAIVRFMAEAFEEPMVTETNPWLLFGPNADWAMHRFFCPPFERGTISALSWEAAMMLESSVIAEIHEARIAERELVEAVQGLRLREGQKLERAILGWLAKMGKLIAAHEVPVEVGLAIREVEYKHSYGVEVPEHHLQLWRTQLESWKEQAAGQLADCVSVLERYFSEELGPSRHSSNEYWVCFSAAPSSPLYFGHAGCDNGACFRCDGERQMDAGSLAVGTHAISAFAFEAAILDSEQSLLEMEAAIRANNCYGRAWGGITAEGLGLQNFYGGNVEQVRRLFKRAAAEAFGFEAARTGALYHMDDLYGNGDAMGWYKSADSERYQISYLDDTESCIESQRRECTTCEGGWYPDDDHTCVDCGELTCESCIYYSWNIGCGHYIEFDDGRCSDCAAVAARSHPDNLTCESCSIRGCGDCITMEDGEEGLSCERCRRQRQNAVAEAGDEQQTELPPPPAPTPTPLLDAVYVCDCAWCRTGQLPGAVTDASTTTYTTATEEEGFDAQSA